MPQWQGYGANQARREIRMLSGNGLAGIFQRRSNDALTAEEQLIRENTLAGLIADKGGE
jgi:hypothetical protein